MNNTVLSIRNYTQHFPLGTGWITAVQNVSFELNAGDIVGLVGESGSGKSTIARAVMGLLSPSEGDILFLGESIIHGYGTRSRRQQLFRERHMLSQDAAAALNPYLRVLDCVAEPFDIVRSHTGKERLKAVQALLEQVELDSCLLEAYPAELSGGQRQRVALARALALQPRLLIADEPVASLDVSTQAHIVHLFERLRQRQGLTLLFIAHDLSLVRYLCDRVVVLWQGRMVELASTQELFDNPLHPYTKALLSAVLSPDPLYERQHKALPLPEAQEERLWTEVRRGHWLAR